MDQAAVVGVAVAVAVVVMDEDEADFREERHPIQAIYVDTDGYRNLEDQTFKEHFRMNRMIFQRLVVTLGNHLRERGRLIRLRTPLDLAVMMSLWILATQDTFRSVAVKFTVPSRGTVHYHYVIVIEALREIAPRFIQWPNQFERDNIRTRIERRHGYPGAVGCIDGTHIYISAPLVQHQRYVNRFRKYSILCQAVSDHTLLFRDIYVGQPGSVHDARMFSRSPLSYNLLHKQDMLSPDEHILGDGAYTLTDKLMTPFRDNGNLNRRQRKYNYVHASSRSCIERAFALLKQKWRRLKLMLAFSMPIVIDTVVASCVLHNFILLQGQPYMDRAENEEPLAAVVRDYEDGMIDEDNENARVVPELDPALEPAKLAGRRKRNFIAFMLHPHNN